MTSEADPDPPLLGDVAAFEPMRFRLRVEAAGNPQQARFLHVVQGADPGVTPDAVALIRSSSGTPFSGVAIRDAAVVFPENLGTPFTGFTYEVTTNTTRHWITGLKPNEGYRAVTRTVGGSVSVAVTAGGDAMTDSGGVLVLAPDRQASLAVTYLADGVVRLRFLPLAGRTHTVQASTDLTQWTDLGVPSLGADNVLQFDDAEAKALTWRFYRVVAR